MAGLSGLYALADVDACVRSGLDVVESALAMADGGASVLQLRAKSGGAEAMRRAAVEIESRLFKDGPRLFINDRADVAAAVGANGVHVGQDDLPPKRLRVEFPSLLVGLSTHNEEKLEEALDDESLAYVAFGPVFATQSKAHAEAEVGLTRLATAYEKTRLRKLPLVAIGGITDATLPKVARACDLVAVIGLLLPEGGSTRPYTKIRERASQIASRLSEWGIGQGMP